MSASRRLSTLIATLAAMTLGTSLAWAGSAVPSIGIHFGADQPNGSFGTPVLGPAGVLGTANWNNVYSPSGSQQFLGVDDYGNLISSNVSVNYNANGGESSSTGDGAENNNAPGGDDRNLMSGYLNPGPGSDGVTLSVSGLSSQPGFASYDVIVYVQGGINGAASNYTLTSTNGYSDTVYHQVTSAFTGAYINDAAGEADHSATSSSDLSTSGSNYLLFPNVSGDSFSLNVSAFPDVNDPTDSFDAGVNGIEIVAAPLPASAYGSAALLLALAACQLRSRKA